MKPPATDLIVALATPPFGGGGALSTAPEGGVILRLSGPGAVDLASRFTSISVDAFPAYGHFSARLRFPPPWPPVPARIWVMRAPRSYTREEVVEWHLPAHPALAEAALVACTREGARLAEPGEFTRRAFEHGRIDLAQVESVSALIAAEDDAALRSARGRLTGRFSREVGDLRDRAISLCAEVEAGIDFIEEDLRFVSDDDLRRGIDGIRDGVAALRERDGKREARGATPLVMLLGRVNAGKSSLFNRLIGRDRTLVSADEGTTRDVVVEEARWGGWLLRLADTPGTAIPGREEVDLARAIRGPMAAEADLHLYVADPSEEPSVLAADLPGLDPGRTLLVLSKADLRHEPSVSPGRDLPAIEVSSRTGVGLACLRREIVARLRRRGRAAGGGALHGAARQNAAIDDARRALEAAVGAIDRKEGAEFVAADLRAAATALGSITGAEVTESVLGEIFRRFCVGK